MDEDYGEEAEQNWEPNRHDPILKQLYSQGKVPKGKPPDYHPKRQDLIQLARTYFPETIGTSKDSINNHVKLLRKKINIFRIGEAVEGGRARQAGM